MWQLKINAYLGDTFEFEFLEDACNFIRKYQDSRVGYGEVEYKLMKVEHEEYIKQKSESVRNTYEG